MHWNTVNKNMDFTEFYNDVISDLVAFAPVAYLW